MEHLAQILLRYGVVRGSPSSVMVKKTNQTPKGKGNLIDEGRALKMHKFLSKVN